MSHAADSSLINVVSLISTGNVGNSIYKVEKPLVASKRVFSPEVGTIIKLHIYYSNCEICKIRKGTVVINK